MRIEETTVATVQGWKITVANIMKGKYSTAAGEQQGLTAVLGRYDEAKRDMGELTVGAGSTLTIADQHWLVESVVAGQGAVNGYIELRRQ
jgi:hypothetical protein